MRRFPLFLLAFLVGCTRGVPAEPSETWSALTIYLFTDRTDTPLEYVYATRGQQVVVQVAEFPGYADRKWYCATIPDKFLDKLQTWAVRPGDVRPPFPAGVPPYCRSTLLPDLDKSEWFGKENGEVRAWLEELREAFVKEEYRSDRLPRWAQNERVKRYLGWRP
jgi:hypothetical protein